MNIPSRPFASLDELHTNELASLEKSAQLGVDVAVLGALRYCNTHQCVIPPWLATSAADLLGSGLKRETAKHLGRAGGGLARNRQDMIHYARWDEVLTVREKQIEILEQTRQLRALTRTAEGLLNDYEEMLEWVGRSLTRAFECASLMLQDTPAFGGPEAMKRSYFKVRRTQKDPAQAFRYYLMDQEIRQSLGLIVHLPQRSPQRPVPLYRLN